VLMPHVLHFNRPVIEPRISRLAAYLGLATPTFDGFMEWLMGMRRDLAIPEDLRALGVDPSRRDELAAMAENDPSAAGNPRKFDHNAAIEVLNGALGWGSDNE
jgi:alcohol dehydrogenase class IV